MIYSDTQYMWYKNVEEFINPFYIAKLFQDMLNNAYGEPVFGVYINSVNELKSIYEYQVSMKYTIEPFSLRGSNSAVLRLRFTTICPQETPGKKEKLYETFQKLCGATEGGFTIHKTDGDVEYFCNMNTKIGEAGSVEVVNAEFAVPVSLYCDMQITRGDGAVVADRIHSYVMIDGQKEEIIYKVVQNEMTVDFDSPLIFNHITPSIYPKSISYPLTLSVLYTNNTVCNKLRDIANGVLITENNPFYDAEKGGMWITIVDDNPDGERSQTYHIVGVQENRERGAFVGLSITAIKEVK